MQTVRHRTHISLDEWQYQALLDVSQKTRKTLSTVIRELITERFAPKAGDISSDSAFEIMGIGKSGHKSTARNHDVILYGAKQ